MLVENELSVQPQARNFAVLTDVQAKTGDLFGNTMKLLPIFAATSSSLLLLWLGQIQPAVFYYNQSLSALHIEFQSKQSATLSVIVFDLLLQ